MPLHLVDHPLAQEALANLRDRATPADAFRRWAQLAALYLMADATRDLPTTPAVVTTPLEDADARFPAPVAVVGILRAGLGLAQPIADHIPGATLGYIGLERDERTAQARAYYKKLPDLRGRRTLVVDPMLATGGSAELALRDIFAAGAEDVRFLCVVAAPEGVARLTAAFPSLAVHALALDRQLDERKYIRPGLGDFGDRLFGT